MRITCPNCTSHFELPTELLGRKGRALKCASCGHAWYQTAQVGELDLAAVMGDDYAAKRDHVQAATARAVAGAAAANVAQGAARAQAQRAPQLGAMGAPGQAPPGSLAPPVPPGAVSMMRRVQGAAAGQVAWNPNQGGPPGQAPAMARMAPGASGGPGAGQVARNPAGARAVGETVANWTRAANGGQPGAAPMMAPLGPMGAHGQPGAMSLPGQSMRGQAGAQAVGDGAISWMRPDGTYPPGFQQGLPPGAALPLGPLGPGQPAAQAGVMVAPGRQPMPAGVMPGMMPGMAAGPGAAALPGQSMRGQAGAQAVGEGAVSWMGKSPPQQPGVLQANPAMQGAAGMGTMPGPGQSLMGQAGAQAVGGGAVSWMGKQAPQPGGVGQSMRNGQIAGPGGPAVSQLTGQIAAPGGPAVSQLTGEIAAPGQGSRSLLDGTTHPAQAGQSMMASGAAGGPAQPLGGAVAGPGAAAGMAGAPGADAQLLAEGRTKADGGVLTAEAKRPRAEGELVAPAKKGGPSGAPGAMSGAPGANEDELVDPDADRPDFGASDEDPAVAEEAAEDDAFASIAARAKPAKRLEASKPIDPAYVTAMVMGGAVVALGLLLFLGRSILLDVWPGMSGFYERIGAETKHVGDGLKIAESSKRLQRIGGIETLVVRGFVSNISDVPQTVPNLKLELYNEKHEVIQDAGAKACAALLDPRGTCEFEVKLELPQVAAAKGGYAVVWAK
jgi:predicted Zn finger-like uncharacterized protein